jgi:hypothetical protein
MKKRKSTFVISITFSIILIIASTYIVLTNTISNGHCKENELIRKEDIANISEAISNGAITIDQFDKEL